jgi:DNA excision repair protein ERCC-2
VSNPACPYYINCMQVNALKTQFNKESMDIINEQMNNPKSPEEFNKLCTDVSYPKCPYELMKATLSKADVVVLHYQYLLDPKVRQAVLSSNWLGADFKDIHLVVDESHNLAPYIQDICSTECTKDDVLEAMKLVRDQRLGDVKYSFKGMEDLLTDLLFVIQDLNIYLDHHFSEKKREELIGEGAEDVLLGDNLFTVPPEKLALLVNTANMVLQQYGEKREKKEIPEDTPMPGICMVAETLKRSAETKGDRYIKLLSIKPLQKFLGQSLDGLLNPNDFEISLKVIDIDPRDSVKYLLDNFRSLTLISGTLSPTNLYRKLLFHSDAEVNERSIPFPFPRENRIIFGCKNVSSQRRLRDNENNIKAIEEILRSLFAVRGNIAVFYTGYELKRQYTPFCLQLCKETGKEPMDENKEINRSRFIENYKKHGNAALFAVCRGSFSEGVDYIGEAMNGVAIIGLPLAPWNMKQQLINKYYETAFGQGVGKTIAYDLPAVTAAVQAAGRCLRSPEDTGVIILADSRYASEGFMGVKKILPEWMQQEMLMLEAENILPYISQKSEEWSKRIPPKPKKQEKSKGDQETYVILETVRETGEKLGTIRIAQILAGSDDANVIDAGYNKIKYYNALESYTHQKIRDKIEELVKQKVLHKTRGLYPTLKLTEKAIEFLETY